MTKRIEAVYSTKPMAIGVGVYTIYEFGSFSPYLILGLLNSSFMTSFLKENFDEKHLAGGYLAINKSTIEKLPLVDINTNSKKEIVEKIENVAKKINDDIDKKEEDLKELDDLVNNLFELTDKEKQLVYESASK